MCPYSYFDYLLSLQTHAHTYTHTCTPQVSLSFLSAVALSLSQEFRYNNTFPKLTFNPSKQITVEIPHPSMSRNVFMVTHTDIHTHIHTNTLAHPYFYRTSLSEPKQTVRGICLFMTLLEKSVSSISIIGTISQCYGVTGIDVQCVYVCVCVKQSVHSYHTDELMEIDLPDKLTWLKITIVFFFRYSPCYLTLC